MVWAGQGRAPHSPHGTTGAWRLYRVSPGPPWSSRYTPPQPDKTPPEPWPPVGLLEVDGWVLVVVVEEEE